MDKREKALTKIRALLHCDGIGFNDYERVIQSLSETVLPTKLTAVYLSEIHRLRNDCQSKRTS